MNGINDAVAKSVFASFALQQRLPITVIEKAAQIGELPLAQGHAPEWFAKAAALDASLLDTAPELKFIEDQITDTSDATPRLNDLVRIYGNSDLLHEPDVEDLLDSASPDESHKRGQIELLRELEGLDD